MNTLTRIRYSLLAESLTLDYTARRTHKGSFIELTDGYTRYELEGDGDDCFVLVHGFSSPYFIYDNLYESLLARTEGGLRCRLLRETA